MKFISPDNEYPRFKGDIKIAHPDWDESKPIPTGWVEVMPTPLPKREQGMAIVEEFPVEVEGTFYQNFSIRPLSPEELQMIEQTRREWEDQQKLFNNNLGEN